MVGDLPCAVEVVEFAILLDGQLSPDLIKLRIVGLSVPTVPMVVVIVLPVVVVMVMAAVFGVVFVDGLNVEVLPLEEAGVLGDEALDVGLGGGRQLIHRDHGIVDHFVKVCILCLVLLYTL